MKVWALVVTVLLAAASQTGADAKDVEVLLDGVTKIAAPGVPGPLCVFGEQAMAVVTGGSGADLREPVVAKGLLHHVRGGSPDPPRERRPSGVAGGDTRHSRDMKQFLTLLCQLCAASGKG